MLLSDNQLLDYTLSSGITYKQVIISDYDNYVSDVYIYDTADLTNPLAEFTNLLASANFMNGDGKKLDAVLFFLQNTGSSSQTVYIDNLKVMKIPALTVSSLKLDNGAAVVNNQTKINKNSNFNLTFNTGIDPSTISGITITPDVADKVISVNGADARIVDIVFPMGLAEGTKYKIRVDSAVKNLYGNGLAGDYEINFTTKFPPDPNAIFEDDFDGWANGYVPVLADGYDIKEGNLSVQNGRLKIERSTKSKDYQFYKRLPETVSSGRILTEFEIEFDGGSMVDYSLAFPALINSYNESLIQPMILDGSPAIGGSKVNYNFVPGEVYRITLVSNLDSYLTDFYIVNVTNPSAASFTRKAIAPPNAYFADGTAGSTGHAADSAVRSLWFLTQSNSEDIQDIYLDNFRMVKIPGLEVTSVKAFDGTQIANGDAGVSPTTLLRLEFNSEIAANSISGVKFLPEADECEINVNTDNPKIIDIILPNALNYETQYTVTLPTTLKGIYEDIYENIYDVALAEAISFTFTTEPEPAVLVAVDGIRFLDFEDNVITAMPADGKVAAEVTVRSLIPFQSIVKTVYVVLALKSEGGALIDISYIKAEIGYGDTQILTIGYENTAPGAHYDLYVWDNLPGTPYSEKNVFPNDV
jgi:hypothetical protein